MLKTVVKSSLPGAGGRGWVVQGVPQGPGGGVSIRCSICSPTRLRGSRGHFWVPGGGCNPLQYMQSNSPPGVLGPGGGMQSAAVYAIQLASGGPGGSSAPPRMRKVRFLTIGE